MSHRSLFRSSALVAAALILAASSIASAAVADAGGVLLDVEYFAGSGDNTSYLIVDFDAQGGGVYTFGYHWDPLTTPSGLDMLTAIDAAGGLSVVLTSFSFGDAVTNFAYNGDAGVPLFDSFFGELWLGEVGGGTVAWTSSLVGAGDRVLTDGSFDGYVNTFDGVQPRVLAVTAAPTPSAAALGLAGVTLLLIGRRRRH